MRARAPSSAANLGPGFDTLAVALGLHCEVSVEPAQRLEISAELEGSDVPGDHDHLAASIARRVLGHDDVAISIRSEIPLRRGLGSSAALALATAAACRAEDPLAVAAEADGHPENAAASFLGGLVAARSSGGEVTARRLALDPGLSYVLLLPELSLDTKAARAVLPETVPFSDAVANLQAMGLLVAGLAERRQLVPEATEDRLHQDRRSQLFPEAPELLTRLVEGGALAASWSGAGPSLIAFCDGEESSHAVAAAGEDALSELAVPGRLVVAAADLDGLQVRP